jgi:hypothetical protein
MKNVLRLNLCDRRGILEVTAARSSSGNPARTVPGPGEARPVEPPVTVFFRHRVLP